VNDGQIFAFWPLWTNPRGELVESCTILTTTPNSLLADIHDRTPAILNPNAFNLWLDPVRSTAPSSEMLRPFAL
jgi:putative SOS response-associated peptidase YedK